MGSVVIAGFDPDSPPASVTITVNLTKHPSRDGYIYTECVDVLGIHMHSKAEELPAFSQLLTGVLARIVENRWELGQSIFKKSR